MLNIITTLIIGILFSMIFESILFTVAYIPMRIYAGGYHTKTEFRCYLSSVALNVIVLLIIGSLEWQSYIFVFIAVVSGIIIFFLAPVEDKNKPLDLVEIKTYKKKARTILLLELFAFAILSILGKYGAATCVLVAIAVLSLMLIAGKLKLSVS